MKHFLLAVGEILLLFLLFFVYTASDVPAVNEAHYLTKAKHYWNPQWCQRDLFLASADAHVVFYWSVGWLTKFFTLPQSAWIGRTAGWLFLAATWWWLSCCLVQRAGWALLTATISVILWDFADMAGEWVVGGIEGKVLAFGFVWLGLASLTRGRWSAVWIWFGAASAFHTLVGGWSVVAAMLVWLVEPQSVRPRLLRMMPALCLGGLLALFGAWPAVQLEQGVDPGMAGRAHYIYVFQRLAHHLVIHQMKLWRIVPHVGLIFLWAWLVRRQGAGRGHRRLHRFAAAALVIAAAGVAIDLLTVISPKLAASWLRFYWFRLSDVMVPVATAFAFADWLIQRMRDRDGIVRRVVPLVLLTAVLVVGTRFAIRRADGRPIGAVRSFVLRPAAVERARVEYANWRDTCDWIRAHTPRDALFLTPTMCQTFKWYAHRAELVTRKDIPQDAASIVEWRGRLSLVSQTGLYRTSTSLDLPLLRHLADNYGIDYVLVDRRFTPHIAEFPLVYRNDHFAVFRVAGKSS